MICDHFKTSDGTVLDFLDLTKVNFSTKRAILRRKVGTGKSLPRESNPTKRSFRMCTMEAKMIANLIFLEKNSSNAGQCSQYVTGKLFSTNKFRFLFLIFRRGNQTKKTTSFLRFCGKHKVHTIKNLKPKRKHDGRSRSTTFWLSREKESHEKHGGKSTQQPETTFVVFSLCVSFCSCVCVCIDLCVSVLAHLRGSTCPRVCVCVCVCEVCVCFGAWVSLLVALFRVCFLSVCLCVRIRARYARVLEWIFLYTFWDASYVGPGSWCGS